MEPRNSLVGTTCLLLAALLIPVGIYFGFAAIRPAEIAIQVAPSNEPFPVTELRFTKGRLGIPPQSPGIITNLQIVDFDRDGLPDVMVCDAQRGQILWYRQSAPSMWDEIVLNQDQLLAAPARASVLDFDQDGDLDVLVAVLGKYTPTDEHVGKAVWLENDGSGNFKTRVILQDVGRVTDVEAGDFDNDGDLDLVVAVFGHYRGKVLWMENDGNQRLREHELLAVAGAIHVPTGDFDSDGDLDIAVLLSQDEESVLAFENTGGDSFRPFRRRLFTSSNFDLGTAGLVPCDLDQDGKTDFLLVAGDNLELHINYPQPWHGCIWLRNLGGWEFEPNRLATFGGTYSAAVGDIDGDEDLDVALVSMFNDWYREETASIVWLENDGNQRFTTWRVDTTPIQLATVACGDLNGDGSADLVAGSFHVIAPFEKFGRVTMWMSEGRSKLIADSTQGPEP